MNSFHSNPSQEIVTSSVLIEFKIKLAGGGHDDKQIIAFGGIL